MTITLTESAAKEIKRVLEDQEFPEGTFVRIGIAAGGCSGFEYRLGFDQSFNEGEDLANEQQGIKLVTDRKSELYLDGTTVDFYEGLEKRGFTFNNPNVQKSCGCGNSFSA